VELAADGHQALAALTAGDFDLALMDCHLPRMDGYRNVPRNPSRDSAVRNHDIPIVATCGRSHGQRAPEMPLRRYERLSLKALRLYALEQAIDESTRNRYWRLGSDAQILLARASCR
jgi:two-component system sensor histidine kinase EvgS